MERVYADSQNKRGFLGMICFSVVCLLILYLVAAFAVPNSFIRLQGKDDCSDNPSYKGMCHTLNFDNSNVWTGYIGRLYSGNQYLLLGGYAIRRTAGTNIELELDYKIKVYPVDKFG